MAELSHVNHDQRLYVMWTGSGYTCIGFDVAFNRGTKYAEWAGFNHPPKPENVGTETGYYEYLHAMQAASDHATRTNTRCPIELHPQLEGLEGRRVEVVDNDGEKYRFWVGKSSGWSPAHLQIA